MYYYILCSKKYKLLKNATGPIPCCAIFKAPVEEKTNLFIERLLIERLEIRQHEMLVSLSRYSGNWDALSYYQAAHYFGQVVNEQPFEQLTQTIPIELIQKYIGQDTKIMALVMGASGMLEQANSNSYNRLLISEFKHLCNKHQLCSPSKPIFKYKGLRPASFPPIRLAQFAALIGNTVYPVRDWVKQKTPDISDKKWQQIFVVVKIYRAIQDSFQKELY